MSLRGVWGWVLLAQALVVVPGCGGPQYIAVTTTLTFGDRGEGSPEVIVAGRRTPVDPSRLAIVWPSQCANETSAAHRGDASAVTTLATNDCSLEMSAFERVLASAGYQVFHWDSLRRRAVAASTTPEAVAEELGIGLLLRVNSLERASVVPGADAMWRRDYARSDRGRSAGPPAVVDPRVANQLDGFAAAHEDEAVRHARLAVTLDVTAVHVPSGEISWFYRWTHAEQAEQAVARRLLAECVGFVCENHGLDPVMGAMAPSGPRSGSTRAISVQREDASVARATYARLMFETISDLVRRVRDLEAGNAAAPARAGGAAR
ncbi:MAG: hypothetical protein KF729_05300 [Sandaracinaceae bacterium]|nr:hypothetical protein [Sandaracinaceae bacterium]